MSSTSAGDLPEPSSFAAYRHYAANLDQWRQRRNASTSVGGATRSGESCCRLAVTESFTVIGRERRPVGIVDVYLGAPAAGRGLMHKGVEISRSLAREVEPSKHE
jgi:hypothetical protein